MSVLFADFGDDNSFVGYIMLSQELSLAVYRRQQPLGGCAAVAGAIARQVATGLEHTKGYFWHTAHLGHRYGRSQRVQTRPYRTLLHQVQTGYAGHHTDGKLTRVRMVASNYQTICVIPRPRDTDGEYVRSRWWCYT